MSERPTRRDVLVLQAKAASLRGTCSRLQVGCVIHRDGRILVTGYNGAPAGLDHCDHTVSVGPCLVASHAERNAIDFAARHGIRLMGSELVTTDTPCVVCAGSIINAGISSVLAVRAYRDPSGGEALVAAGVIFEMHNPLWSLVLPGEVI